MPDIDTEILVAAAVGLVKGSLLGVWLLLAVVGCSAVWRAMSVPQIEFVEVAEPRPEAGYYSVVCHASRGPDGNQRLSLTGLSSSQFEQRENGSFLFWPKDGAPFAHAGPCYVYQGTK